MRNEELEIIARDPDLPGLRLLFDESMMCHVLQTQLPEMKITGLQRRYIRYKRTSNCLMKYELSTADGQITLYAKAHHRDDRQKLTKVRQSNVSDTHCLILPEHSVVICFLPLDKKLRILTRLCDPSERPSLLKRVLYDNDTFSPCSLTILQYKPERRFVAQLKDKSGNKAVLKIYTQSRYQQAIHTCRQTIEGQSILPLIGRSNKHHIIVYRWLPGQSLREIWLQPGFNPDNLIKAGQHLAHFHRKKQSETLPERNSQRYCMSLKQLAHDITQLLPGIKPDIKKLADKTAKCIKMLNSGITRIHGDFYADQVLIDSGQVTLIDLDNVCRWYPTCDLGLFIAHIEWDYLRGQLSRQQADSYIGALINGYQQITPCDLNQVWLFTAAGLLQLAHHPFRNCEPQWPEHTVAIIRKSEQYLHQSQPDSVHISDSGIPNLDKLQDIAFIEPYVIEALRACCPVLNNARLTKVIPLRHKQGKRALLEYVFQPGGENDTAPSLSVIGKVRAKGFDQRTWQANCELAESGFCHKPPKGTQIPVPLGALPEFRIWFQQKVSGRDLFDEFCHSDGHRLAQRVAKAIYQLHHSPVTINKFRTVQDELDTLHQGLKWVIHHQPQWQAQLTQLLAQCDKLATELPAGPQQLIHRDFYHDQIIVTDNALYLLDLDLLSIGDPALDLGNFIAHIQEQCLRQCHDLHYADPVLETLIGTYQSLTSDNIKSRTEAYRLLSMVRHIYISQRIKTRNSSTQAILNYCEKAIQTFLSR